MMAPAYRSFFLEVLAGPGGYPAWSVMRARDRSSVALTKTVTAFHSDQYLCRVPYRAAVSPRRELTSCQPGLGQTLHLQASFPFLVGCAKDLRWGRQFGGWSHRLSPDQGVLVTLTPVAIEIESLLI